MNNKVSIVVPCYNVEKYLIECLESVYNQTYKNTEVILVNDGSKDGTEEILLNYYNRYPDKTKYFFQENSGLASARNKGVVNCTGEYICFIDSDDVLTEDSVLKRLHVLESNNEIDFIYSDAYIIEEDSFTQKTMKMKVGNTYSGKIFNHLLKDNFIIMPTVMMRKSIFKKENMFNEKLRRIEDYELWLRLSYSGYVFKYIDEKLAYYRIRSNSLSANLNEMDIIRLEVYEDILKAFKLNKSEKEIIEENIKSISYYLYDRLCREYIDKGNIKDARKNLYKKIKLKKEIKQIFKYILLLLFPQFVLKYKK